MGVTDKLATGLVLAVAISLLYFYLIGAILIDPAGGGLILVDVDVILSYISLIPEPVRRWTMMIVGGVVGFYFFLEALMGETTVGK